MMGIDYTDNEEKLKIMADAYRTILQVGRRE